MAGATQAFTLTAGLLVNWRFFNNNLFQIAASAAS
jgi:hypothetical protein